MHKGELITKTIELKSDPDENKTKWTIRQQTFQDLLDIQTDSGLLPARLVDLSPESMQDDDYVRFNSFVLRRALSIVAHGLISADDVVFNSPEEVVSFVKSLQPASAVASIIGELSAQIINLGHPEKK